MPDGIGSAGFSAKSTGLWDVSVVGAGPTGLLVAAELALAGLRVQVLERLPTADSTIKAGSINVATAEVLHRRGLLPAAQHAQRVTLDKMATFAAAKGVSPRGKRQAHRHTTAESSCCRSFPITGHFAAMMFRPELVDHTDPGLAAHTAVDGATLVTQQQVEAVLGDHAQQLGVSIRRGVEVLGIEQDEESVVLHTTAGPEASGWVVAADGGRSTLRKVMGIGFSGTDAEITGYQAIVEMHGGEHLQPGWTWTTRGVYSYGPIPGRILTVQFDHAPTDRAAAVTAEEVQASVRLVSGQPITITGLHGRATRWTDNARQADTYRVGRVLLAGDAAHVHSPFSGQGLNLGVGDAINLGWKLAATIRGWAPEGLLDTYAAERAPIAKWVLEWTRGQVALMRGDTKTAELRNIVERQLLDTVDGMTRVVALTSGIAQRYALKPGDPTGVGYDRTGPLDVGRLIGDVKLTDGTYLADHTHGGRFVLLDRSADHRYALEGAHHADRVLVVNDENRHATSALVRPDGVVAWTGSAHYDDDELADLQQALNRWARACPITS